MTARLVLVTGAGGYIGGRLVASLREQGVPVRPAVRSAGARSGGDPAAVRVDLSSGQGLDKACAGATDIVHLAAVNASDAERDAPHAVDVNIKGTLQLLSSAARAGVERFVYLSTAHVYGTALAGTVTERTPPEARSIYAITHRTAEDLVRSRSPHGVALRLSNAVGAPTTPPKRPSTLLVNDLCHQAVVTGELRLSSTGTAWRNWIAMDDVIRAIIHVLDVAPSVGGRVFNLGSTFDATVRDVADLIARRAEAILGVGRPTLVAPPPEGDPPPRLTYESDELAKTGYLLGTEIIDAVDETLRFSFRHFGSATA